MCINDTRLMSKLSMRGDDQMKVVGLRIWTRIKGHRHEMHTRDHESQWNQNQGNKHEWTMNEVLGGSLTKQNQA